VKITAKIIKRFNLLFKILLVIVVYLFLFFELAKHKDNLWGAILSNTSSLVMNYFWMAAFLMPVNWLIESIKWRFLVQKIEKVKLWDAYQAVFAGNAISIFTPNRIGDYLGRIFILKEGDRIDGTLVTIAGNISQLLVTLLMGSISVIYFSEQINNHFFHLPPVYVNMINIGILFIDILLLFLFFRFPNFEKQIHQNMGISKYPFFRHLTLLSEFKTNELFTVLLFSFFRYLIYSLQFYFIFRAFHIPFEIKEGLFIVFLIFFGITIIPSIAVAELGIRGLITVFIFNVLWQNQMNLSDLETAMVSSSSLLWLINLALPAMIGGVFIFKLRFLRKKDNIEIQIPKMK